MARSPQGLRVLDALRQRDFRLVWASTLLSSSAEQMEMVVLGWFVLQLTGSPLLVGLITAARFLGTLLAPFAGAVADRMSRHRLILQVQSLLALLAFIMFLVIVSGVLQVWHIFAITLVKGLARQVDQPARQALLVDVVESHQVSNAAALTVVARNGTAVLGPVLGGSLFALLGPEGAYFAMASLYLGGVLVLLFAHPRRQGNPVAGESVWQGVLQGLAYVRRHEILYTALIMAALVNLTAFPLNFTLMPVFARDVLHTDSVGLGLLAAAIGVGALIGSVGLAWFSEIRHRGRFLLGAGVAWHAMMMVFAASSSFQLSLLLITMTGLAQSLTIVTIAVLLLSIAGPQYRGRVMGLRSLAVYTLPLGGMVSGALANWLGAPLTAVVNGGTGILLILVLGAIVPRVRKG